VAAKSMAVLLKLKPAVAIGNAALTKIRCRIVRRNEDASQRKLHTLWSLHIISAPQPKYEANKLYNIGMDFCQRS
jgi:hypothetical protein